MDNIIKQELMSCICDMYCKHPQEMTESELEIECSFCRIVEIINELITSEYNNMISAFQCDFSLAKNENFSLSELDFQLKDDPEGQLSADIILLEKLEFGLRYGKILILEMRKNND